MQPTNTTHLGVGISGLIDYVIAVLPLNYFKALFYKKMESREYEGVSKSPRTMLITRESLVVHEFPARVYCGGVL